MARLNVLEFPDPRLRTRAQPVQRFDAALASLVDDMFETMYATNGMGLAATQVGVHQQVITIDVSGNASAPEVFVNPRILLRSRLGLVEESCLSLPGVCETVKRHTALRFRAFDRAGKVCERNMDGLLAVCLQHEMDHLAGKLFIDRLSFLQRLRVRKALQRRPAGSVTAAAQAEVPVSSV